MNSKFDLSGFLSVYVVFIRGCACSLVYIMIRMWNFKVHEYGYILNFGRQIPVHFIHHMFLLFLWSLSIKVYVIINVNFSHVVKRYMLSPTSQQCSSVKIVPHHCSCFKRHRNSEISCKLGHNHWTFEVEVSVAPPIKLVNLQPKYVTDKTDFGYAFRCRSCIPLIFITSFLLHIEILQK